MLFLQIFDDKTGSGILLSPIKVLVTFNFNGTVIFGNSINVKKIDYLGLGNYRINYLQPLQDVNYSIFVSGCADDSGLTVWGGETATFSERLLNSTAVQLVNAVGTVNPSATSILIIDNFG